MPNASNMSGARVQAYQCAVATLVLENVGAHQGTFLYCRAKAKETGECSKILYSDEGLISHVQCKHMDVQVVCLECSIAVFPGYLAHHITSVHSNDATVRCVAKECGDSSQFVLRILEPNKVQHDVRLHFHPVFGVCLGVRRDWKDYDFMASDEGHLGRHVYVKHHKTAIVKCEECGKSVKNYKKHVRVFHAQLRSNSG